MAALWQWALGSQAAVFPLDIDLIQKKKTKKKKAPVHWNTGKEDKLQSKSKNDSASPKYIYAGTNDLNGKYHIVIKSMTRTSQKSINVWADRC